MTWLAIIVTFMALVGAVVSFIVGARVYLNSDRCSGGRARSYLVIVWPFMLSRIRPIADEAPVLNKSIVALISCLTIAAAAGSLAANCHRLTR